MSKQMREQEWASARVAIAKAAVTALDEAMRSLRLQRKAAQALYERRLAEHTQAILARPASSTTDDRRAEEGA